MRKLWISSPSSYPPVDNVPELSCGRAVFRYGRIEGEQNGPSSRPGPVYDAAMRGVIEADPGVICRLLEIPVGTPNGAPELLPASFPSPGQTLHADLVLRVGPDQLAHVEYERRPTGNLVARMHAYLGAIGRWSRCSSCGTWIRPDC
jgi:hypothetical protein